MGDTSRSRPGGKAEGDKDGRGAVCVRALVPVPNPPRILRHALLYGFFIRPQYIQCTDFI